MRRRDFIILGGTTAGSLPFVALGQPSSATPVIGVLSSQSQAAVARPLDAFIKRLKALGHEDGKSIAIEYRWAEGQYERLPALAGDLVQRKVAVIVTLGGDPPAIAAKAATSTIPIVFVVGSDPVKFGLVASLNKPSGNATGVNLLITEVEAKRIGLLHELVPTARRIALLVNLKTVNAEAQIKDIRAATDRLNLTLDTLAASNDTDLDLALTRLRELHPGALIVEADPFFVLQRNKIISQVGEEAIPAIYPLREFPASGGLISYGTDLVDAYRQVADYVDRIIEGEKAADLPVVQLEKFETVINQKTARALGLTVPFGLLNAADEVIE
jgi:putative tryptophan/tyrosine transport system substrate-binding protein